MLVAPKPLKLKAPKPISTPQMETTQYPTSVSISELLRAGQLTKPKLKKHVSLVLERYDVKFGTWNDDITLELLVESETLLIILNGLLNFTMKLQRTQF